MFWICRLPDDIWLVDLDSNKITPPSGTAEEIPNLPEPEGTILKNHLKQVSAEANLRKWHLLSEGNKVSSTTLCGST